MLLILAFLKIGHETNCAYFGLLCFSAFEPLCITIKNAVDEIYYPPHRGYFAAWPLLKKEQNSFSFCICFLKCVF